MFSDVSDGAPPPHPRNAGLAGPSTGHERVQKAEAQTTSVQALRGVPSMEDGLAPDPDMSDNDSRHFVSVSRLPGAAVDASSSAGSLWLSDDDGRREMGDEMHDEVKDRDGDGVDRRYRWASADAVVGGGGDKGNVIQSTENAAAQRQPQRAEQQPAQQVLTSPPAELESSLFLMSQIEANPKAQRATLSPALKSERRRISSATSQHSDIARYTWTATQSRFRRGGHSAGVLAAQRVLTLLLLRKPIQSPTVMKNGTEVTLRGAAAAAASGAKRDAAKTLTVDEAVPVADADECIRSSLLRELAEEVRDGHCATLLLSVAGGSGEVGYRAVENTLGLLLAAMIKQEALMRKDDDVYEDTEDFYFKMEASIALIYKGKYTKDLIVNREEELGALAPARPIANPLLGSWCDNTLLQGVRSGSQIKKLLLPVQAWLAKSPAEAENSKEVICVYVAVRQVNHLSKPVQQRTLTLSSLLIYVSRAEDGAVGLLQNRQRATPLQRSLIRRVGDGCFTVAAACIGEADEHASAFATRCADACAVKNSGFVSGDARRYMDALRKATAKETAEEVNVRDSHERLRAQQRRDMRIDLLRGLSCLVEDPAHCAIPFYPDRIAAREEAAAATQRAAQDDPSDVRAASMSSGMLLQSILSSKYNIRIPDTEEALEMFGDCRVHTVAIRSAKKACGYELIDGTSCGLVRLEDQATFFVDELRPRRILPSLHTLPITAHTSALCTLFTSGYNAALISFDGRSDNVFTSPVWYVLAEAIDRALNRTDARRSEVRIAFSVVRGSGEALDLMADRATMVPLQVSSSPLFGTAVHTSTLHPVTSSDTLRGLLYRVAPAAASVWGSGAFLHVLLVNLFTTDDDVFVSSLNLSVLGSHASLCQRILANGKAACEGDAVALHPDVLRLHYGFLSGSAASVFLVSLNNAEDSNSAMAMMNTAIPPLTKTANRSGSVREFLRRTRTGLEKRRLKAQSAPAGERADLARMERRIAEMLDDAATLLDPEARAFPKAYLSEQPAAAAQPKARRGVLASSAAPPEALPPPARVAPAKSPAEKERALREDSWENGASVSPHAPSSGKASARENVHVGPAVGAAAAVSVSHPQWVLGLELGGTAVREVQVSGAEVEWTPTKERFDSDGVLFYNSTHSDMRHLFTEKCAPMQRLRENACAARSCSILGFVDGGSSPDMHVRTQPLWRSFTALVLNSAFQRDEAATTWRDGSELHLRMCAVQDRTVVHDFLLDTDDAAAASGSSASLPARVALAANPLFGPVVRNTTVMRAENALECQCVLRSGLDALNSLAGEYPSGTIVIASAVLKNVNASDILFSSITAFGVRVGKDLPALRDILAMDPKGGAPPSLYHYALHGPCHLLCLTTLDSSANVHCVEALRLSQGIRYGTTAPVPAGSLGTCLREQQELLAHSRMVGQARANTEHVVRQLAKMMDDPFAPIVIFPFDDDDGVSPPVLMPDKNTNRKNEERAMGGTSPAEGSVSVGAGGTCCRCTAVVTAVGRNEAPTLDARTETNTVHVARTSYPFSEVVLRANNSSVLRPGLISSIVQRVQQGCNTALVVADGVGSNAGAALLSKLVSLLIRNTGDNGHGVNTTLFMSITAIRFSADSSAHDGRGHDEHSNSNGGNAGPMVKDLFSGETQFYPLQVARSPFFGPCVDGARFSSLNRIGDVYLTLKDAQKACSFLRATLVVAIVLKQVTRAADGAVKDMLMSSLFSVISTAETSNGHYACNVFDDMLDQREAALAARSPEDPRAAAWRGCLLAQAFGGESFTYGVVGLSAYASTAEATALLKFGARLMRVPCRLPSKSSAVDVLAHAQQQLRESQTADCEESREMVSSMPWDWREIAAEAEEMLHSPDTCKPRAFLCE